ncbi:MAG TPA: MFS transporter, partial [Flavisolibacter sp.]|nr:MFS transporter [Flavisolibacter sp.]
KFEWKRANPLGALWQLRKYPSIGGLVLSLVLIGIASHAVQSNWTFFSIEKFGWSEKIIGISLGMFGLLIAIVQGGLIRFTNPILGNKKSVYLGLALYALGLVLFAFASQSWMMFLFMIPYCMGGIAGPALQAIITGYVPPNEQGEIQGVLTSLMSATSIVGPPLMTNLFAYYTGTAAPVHFPGVAFLLGAVLMLVSSVVAYATLKGEVEVSVVK